MARRELFVAQRRRVRKRTVVASSDSDDQLCSIEFRIDALEHRMALRAAQGRGICFIRHCSDATGRHVLSRPLNGFSPSWEGLP